MIGLKKNEATFFVPDAVAQDQAFARTTHLAVGTHQDDLEFMALHGILACYQRDDQWFGGITCTNGSGSARAGDYAAYSDAEMMTVRHQEQEAAAVVGQYSFVAQLAYPSADIKDTGNTEIVDDLTTLLQATQPSVVYTHNPADKHDTHVAVCTATLAALRRLPTDARPARVLGCEIWRDLDWLPDDTKQVLDVSAHTNLAAALNGIFDSQIAGGKRYDLAVMGRRRANATFFASHETDAMEQAWFAMDLTPLIEDDFVDLANYTLDLVDHFRQEVANRINTFRRDG